MGIKRPSSPSKPKTERREREDCNSTCVLTRHTILNLRSRNYSDEGMYCTCHTRERKEKRLMNKKQKWQHITKDILPKRWVVERTNSWHNRFRNCSHDMKRRLRTIQGWDSSHVYNELHKDNFGIGSKLILIVFCICFQFPLLLLSPLHFCLPLFYL